MSLDHSFCVKSVKELESHYDNKQSGYYTSSSKEIRALETGIQSVNDIRNRMMINKEWTLV